MPLTDAQIRSFKPIKKRFRKSDGSGLYIEIMPSGGKYFRLACRFRGQQRTFYIGEYPDTKLSDARLRAAEYKKAVKQGIDPTGERKQKDKPQGPFWADIAKDYLKLRQRSGAAHRTMRKLDRQIQVTIAALGDKKISEISAENVLDVVNPIADAGHVENAHEIRSRFSQIFRYAAARGIVKSDPASLTVGAMVPRRRGKFAALIDPKEIGELIRDIKHYRRRHLWVGSALILSAFLFPRNSEIRGMRWCEIDWEDFLWEVPKERMKMNRAHLFPLPAQAIEILSDLRNIDVGTELVFPSPRDPTKMMSENTFNKALKSMGYPGHRHVHHGFRTTASTLLNEMGWNADWIERQLAHVQKNKVRASYNRAEYLDDRKEMMAAYADKLEELAGNQGEPEQVRTRPEIGSSV